MPILSTSSAITVFAPALARCLCCTGPVAIRVHHRVRRDNAYHRRLRHDPQLSLICRQRTSFCRLWDSGEEVRGEEDLNPAGTGRRLTLDSRLSIGFILRAGARVTVMAEIGIVSSLYWSTKGEPSCVIDYDLGRMFRYRRRPPNKPVDTKNQKGEKEPLSPPFSRKRTSARWMRRDRRQLSLELIQCKKL